MKYLRYPSFPRLLSSPLRNCRQALLVLLLLSSVPMALAEQPDQRSWAGNWLVVGESDQQLVWQLNADGTGFAYGFQPNGRLSHGFAINWQLDGDRVRVRTGASVRCSGGVVAVAFVGWSAATLDFAIVDGRHWLQRNGGLLAFQRRLQTWKTPRAGNECPNLAS
ncbi:hypothetical protein Maes01_01123 [Microbulbifer aestuariivivens]|uniref:DUF2147 domain-containing protein n=1 Tax=Microbulbifer aestuariivivens TaxID=1908308 RepID=A0ABP9WMX4_9GAMM